MIITLNNYFYFKDGDNGRHVIPLIFIFISPGMLGSLLKDLA